MSRVLLGWVMSKKGDGAEVNSGVEVGESSSTVDAMGDILETNNMWTAGTESDFVLNASCKGYPLAAEPCAVSALGQRGWHLLEKHVMVDGQPMSGSLFDFGLYFFHNAKEALSRGTGPYFYLPKLESHLEARLWNDVFVAAQEALGVPQKSIKATVLIETIRSSLLDVVEDWGIEVTRVEILDVSLDEATRAAMLQQLNATYPYQQCVCGNAEQLPFADACIDNIYSNLALQWCHDFSAATSEMARVLKSGGEAHLSIVAAGSLEQLSTLGLRVNSFLSLESLQAAFDDTDWQFLDVKLMPMTVYFQDLKALLYSIKGVGASVQSSLQSLTSSESDAHLGKLRGRCDWQALQQRAEQFREAQGLPLTYQIAQFRVRRQGCSV